MIDITPEFELLNFQVPLWYVFGRRNGPANITDLFSALEKVPLWCKTLTQNSQSTNRAVFTTHPFLPLRKSLLGLALCQGKNIKLLFALPGQLEHRSLRGQKSGHCH